MSDEDGRFNGTHTLNDFTRGTSYGGATNGGIYAFDTGGDNTILGVQPSGADFTPGTITLRVQNNTGAPVIDPTVSYKIWSYNDQGRSSFLNFFYSGDDITYTPVVNLDFTTTQTATVSPAWQMVERQVILSGVTIQDGNYLYLQWQSNDVGGSGSRDEFGIDDVLVNFTDLKIAKSVSPSTAIPGSAVTYTLSFTNGGLYSAHGVIISDSVPVSITFRGVTNSTIGGASISQTSGTPDFAWDVSDLAVGAGGYITLTGILTDTFLTATTIENTVTITASNDITATNNSSNAALSVVAGPFNYEEMNGENITVTRNGDLLELRVNGVIVARRGIALISSVSLSTTGTIDIAGHLDAGSNSVSLTGTVKNSQSNNPDVTGNVSIDGTLVPGASPGIVTVNGNVTLTAADTFEVEIDGTSAGSGYDQLQVTGAGRTITLGGATLSLAPTITPSVGDQFVIIDAVASDSAVTGMFNGLPQNSLFTISGRTTYIDYFGGSDFNDVVLTACSDAITVTDGGDSGGGSGPDTLREAIDFICPGGTITIDPTVSTVSLTSIGFPYDGDSALAILKPITIIGNDAVIQRDTATEFRMFFVAPSAALTLTHATVSNGVAASIGGNNGGGIYSYGNLTIINASVYNNSANYNGGAIFMAAFDENINLTLQNSQVISNSVDDSGGGIYLAAEGGNILFTLQNSQVISNSAGGNDFGGGGIFADASSSSQITMTIESAAISRNISFDGGGGGMQLVAGSDGVISFAIVDTQIISNTDASLADDTGGGMNSHASGSGTIYGSLNRSLVAENFNRVAGGGVSLSGDGTQTLIFTNTTFSGNRTNGDGGGLYAESGTVDLYNVTVTDNTADADANNTGDGGGLARSGGSTNLYNTLVAGNQDGSSGPGSTTHPDISGAFSSGNYNLIGDATGGSGLSDGYDGNQVGSNVSPIDPLLGPLQDNGDSTQTHGLLPGSPAIDTGKDGGDSGTTTSEDQRGYARPVDLLGIANINDASDIGAFEVQVAQIAISKAVTPTVAAPGDTVTYTLLFSNTSPTTTAEGIVITDAIPISISVSSVISSGIPITQTSPSSLPYVWQVADMAANSSGYLTITGVLSNSVDLLGTTIDNTALITTSSLVSTTANHSASVSHSVGLCFATPDSGTTVYSSLDAHAVQQAVNASSSGGEVRVAGYCAGVESYGGGVQSTAIDKSLTLRGGYTVTDRLTGSPDANANPTTIDALALGRVISIALGVDVLIENLRITDGETSDSGAGIRNEGTLIISNTHVYSNYAEGNGSGIRSYGPLEVIDSDVSDNYAEGDGGGIASTSWLTITNSLLEYNYSEEDGGGIDSNGNSIRIFDSTIRYNEADEDGGGIDSDGPLTVRISRIESNSAYALGGSSLGGGGIHQDAGDATIEDSLMILNYSDFVGGGIFIAPDFQVTITNTQILTNEAVFGGGMAVAGGTVTIWGSRVISNTALDTGGGIDIADGNVTISATQIFSNTAEEDGGGINHSDGTLVLQSAEIHWNGANDDGGGLALAGGTTTITATRIISNTAHDDGGGLTASDGLLTIVNSAIDYNLADGDGGGLDSDSGSITRIISSTLNYNRAGEDGGGIDADDFLTIERSQVWGNSSGSGYSGGGIHAEAPMTITHSLIADNSTGLHGGGVFVTSTAPITLVNTTISGNQSTTGNGGGIGVDDGGSVALFNVTVADNSTGGDGGGLYAGASTAFALRNSLSADNSAGGSGPDAFGTFTSAGYNLLEESAGSSGFMATGDQVDVSLLLDVLDDNDALVGYQLHTHALLAGSPAIDGGNPAGCVDGVGTPLSDD